MDWPIELHALNDLEGSLPVSDFEWLTVGHGSKSKSVSPSEHQPIPAKIGSEMGGAPKTPKWDPIGEANPESPLVITSHLPNKKKHEESDESP